MSAKRRKKERRVFNMYNLLILLCILVILGSAYFLLEKQGVDVRAYIENILPKNEEVATNEDTNKNTKTETKTNSKVETTPDNSNSKKPVKTENNSSGAGITQERAIEIAIEKFKELGESQLLNTEVEVIKIQRQGVEYYYISSPENTIEVKIEDGKITRLNSVLVD